MKSKKLLKYISIVILLSWILQIAGIIGTSSIHSKQAEFYLLLTMCVPAIVTLAYLIATKSLRSKVIWKPNLRVFPAIVLGILIPTLLAFSVVFIACQVGYGEPRWFTFSTSGVMITGGPWILGLGSNFWLLFIANVFVTATVHSIISAIPAAAEEFAWRGFLQGILVEKLGLTKGIICLGLIWSFWHLPALLAGYNQPDYPLLGSFILQPIQEVAVSFFLGWLTLSCRSFIPAAVAHGAGNSIQEGVISNIVLSVPTLYRDIIVLLLTVSIGLIFWGLLRLFPSKRYSEAG